MADRTVSARLRADVTGFIASMRAAQRAVNRLSDDIERSARRSNVAFETSRGGAVRFERTLRRLIETQQQQAQQSQRQSEQMRRNTDETRRNTQSQHSNTRGIQRSNEALSQQQRLLLSAGTAAGLLAVAETSAATAAASFGLLAAPSIAKVVSAQQDLAANWSSLSTQQQGTALQVRALADGYQALADSFQPQALSAFNSVLGVGETLMFRFSDVANATAGDVQGLIDRLAGFAAGPEMNAFLTAASQNAPRALHEFGTTATTAGSLALQLATDLTPVGLTLLSVANGALGLVNSLAQVNPVFAQFAVTALLLRAPIMGLIGGVTALSARMRAYAASTAGATLATRALTVAAAVGPALLVTAAAGLFLWASRAGEARNSSERLADSLEVQHRAFGNNIVGYRSLANDLLPRLEEANRRLKKAIEENNEAGLIATNVNDQGKVSFQQAAEAVFAYGNKIEKARTAERNLTNTSKELARTYRITQDAALQLATAAGVDLSKAVDKQGFLTFEAAKKIDTYRRAVEDANDPTVQIQLSMDRASNTALSLKDRMEGLTAAFDAHFNPSLAVFNSTTQLRQGFRDLADEVARAEGRMNGNTEASLKLRQQFASQLNLVRDLASAVQHKAIAEGRGSQATQLAAAAVREQLPLLLALAGNNRAARAQVEALARSLGIEIGSLRISRGEFIKQATSMLGSRAAAERLWAAYQKLTAAQNRSTGSLNVYIQRVRDAAAQARIQALRTDGAAGAQGTYNARVRAALPVLYALAGRNREARAQVDALARATGNAAGATNVSRRAFLAAASAMGIARAKAEQLWREMRKIKDRKADIRVSATGVFTRDPGRLIPGLATGGPVPSIGPESTRAYDSVPAMLRVDEHVWTPEEVDAVGGHGAMLRMRALARRGQLQGFARGGPVDFAGRGPVRRDVGVVMRPVFGGIDGMVRDLSERLAEVWKKFASGGKALAWARTQAGKPYIWGGVGPAGYDCSGWTSALTNVIQGRNPHQRRHTTHSFGARGGPDGFVRNRHSAFQVGVTDAGVGHMAGTLSGVAVESSGSAGVRVGGGARGANHPMFTRQYGLRMAQGGAVTDEEARLARQALRPGATRREVDLAATLGLIGDPSSKVSPVNPRVPAFGAGGWVRGVPGKDKNLIAASDREFVVNAGAAGEFPALLEALNAGQVGRAFIAPTRSAAGGGASAQTVNVTLQVKNHGVIGSRMETEDWLIRSLESAHRRGRTPWMLKR